MRRAFAALLTALTLALAGCAGLPTSGAVNPGLSPIEGATDPEIRFVPNAPQKGATPEDIVTGFIRAGSGPQGEWAIAREYLTSDFRSRWNPRASVTVDQLADRSTPSEPVDGVSTVQVAPTGLVDATGAYTPQAGVVVDLDFTLVQEDGQWRISHAPDGVVLFEEEFRSVYRSVSLQYFDPGWRYLVPDVRWYPRANIATAVATALVDGAPSAWLEGAVRSAFPEDVSVVGSVPSVDSTAQVELSSAALPLGQSVLDRMLTQLQQSLASAGVSSVRMTVGGAALDATAVTLQSTRVDQQSLVERAGGQFGFAEGDGVEAIPVSEAVQSVEAVAVEVAPELDVAAVRTAAGTVLRAGPDAQLATVDDRPGLVDPTIDGSGTIWTVPAGAPMAVIAHPVDGDAIAVSDAWPAAAGISAMRVSRDGTRLAAVVSVRGHSEIWVAGIRPTDEGAALALGPPVVLGTLDGEARGLAWLDDATVAALDGFAGEVALREQPVGGPGTELTVPEGTTAIVGGNGSARLRGSDGAVYVRQGPNWAQILGDVTLLAGQQGTPS